MSANELETRTMRMYLQSMSRAGFVCVFLAFVIAYSATLIVGKTQGPGIILETVCYPEGKCEAIDVTNTVWTKSLTNLDKLNQELFVTFNTTNVGKTKAQFPASFQTTILEIDQVPVMGKEVPVERRVITCLAGEDFCNPIFLEHVPFLSGSNFTVQVKFVPGDEPLTPANLARLQQSWISFQYYNEEYTLFELWFRFTFLILTFVVIVLFAHKLRNYRWTDWQVEQKWTAFILFGLMAANNPFFALELFFSSPIPVFLDQLMLVTFVSMLLLFWLVMFDGVRKDAVERTLLKFYAPKVLLVGLFWLTSLIMFTIAEVRLLDNYEFDEKEEDPNIVFFIAFLIILSVVYLFWVLYVVCRACQESRTFPLLGVRIRFFALFTMSIIAVMVIGLSSRTFGPTSAGQGTPMSLLAFLALYNYYSYVLAFMYLPSRFAVKGASRHNIGLVKFADNSEDSLGDSFETDEQGGVVVNH